MVSRKKALCLERSSPLNQCPLPSLIPLRLLALQHHHQPHYAQHGLFQPRVLAQQNRDVADKGNEADHAADDVLFAVQVGLARGVELGVVCEVVVAFCEEAEGGFSR